MCMRGSWLAAVFGGVFVFFTFASSHAQAATLSLTHTAGGPTLVGGLDAVSSFSFGGGNGNFVSALDALSPVIAQDANTGTTLFEVDLTGTALGNVAFQNVIFTAFNLLPNAGSAPSEFVSFTYGTSAITTPLPAALPLFATGLAALGLLGWRRKRKALAT